MQINAVASAQALPKSQEPPKSDEASPGQAFADVLAATANENKPVADQAPSSGQSPPDAQTSSEETASADATTTQAVAATVVSAQSEQETVPPAGDAGSGTEDGDGDDVPHTDNDIKDATAAASAIVAAMQLVAEPAAEAAAVRAAAGNGDAEVEGATMAAAAAKMLNVSEPDVSDMSDMSDKSYVSESKTGNAPQLERSAAAPAKVEQEPIAKTFEDLVAKATEALSQPAADAPDKAVIAETTAEPSVPAKPATASDADLTQRVQPAPMQATHTVAVKSAAATETPRAEALPAPHVLSDTVVRGVRLLVTEGERTMTVRLSPPSLGDMRIEVTSVQTSGTAGESVSVRLIASNPVVRDSLESQLGTLRDALTQNGVTPTSISVMADTSFNLGAGQRGYYEPAPSVTRAQARVEETPAAARGITTVSIDNASMLNVLV